MDNASKALVMAGGVMIAMAIIGLAVAALSHAMGFAKENENAMSTSQIESFNRFYTAYVTTYTGPSEIRCIDAINILNRAIEDELQAQNSSAYISNAGGFYSGDPVNYVDKKVKYELKYNSGIGIIEKVIISD